ncbi:CheR family methyltransferase, partial [Nocardioides lianchengensis]
MSISTASFSFVCDVVRTESAIVLNAGKEYLVESRLIPLAKAAGHTDVDSYVAELQSRRNPAALRAVVEALTTNETSWFRDADPFNTLKTTVFPTLAKSRPSRQLRVWSAACSSGQEAYSISMVAS